MSYEIEFDGSLVDNRDLNQVTASSSLTLDTAFQASPASWQFNTQPLGTVPSVQSSTGFSTQTEIYSSQGLVFSIQNIGGVNSLTANLGGFELGGFYLHNNGFAGQNTQIQFRTSNNGAYNVGNIFNIGYRAVGGGNLGSPLSNVTMASATTYTYNFNIPANVGYIDMSWFSFGAPLALEFLIVTSGSATSISTTPSTITNGSQKTGGSLITATPATIQNGAGSVTGPANKFGLVAKDGTAIKSSAQYYPPALDSEGSEAAVTDVRYITADNTSLSVEGVGLGGTEKLQNKSSILVEDVDPLGEN